MRALGALGRGPPVPARAPASRCLRLRPVPAALAVQRVSYAMLRAVTTHHLSRTEPPTTTPFRAFSAKVPPLSLS